LGAVMSDTEAAERESVAERATAAEEPSGIGGWLLLVAFGQVAGVLRLLVMLGQQYSDPENLEAFAQFPLLMYGELAMNLCLSIFVIVLLLLFFGKSRYFQRFFIVALLLAIASPAVNILWVALALSIQLGSPFTEFLEFERQEKNQMILGVISALIWTPYVLKSKRVRNTFVH
jgi:hypothetical protein